ncbi:MAG TPA: tRNA lysidine(34) synthetase TilS [Thermoanaerobaculia bacterium]|nr:tRNA lysidine(34) synthetase TilS [Thermoanaerobaculia bacterium]
MVALADWSPRPFFVSALHVNHHLRGEESDGDARFIQSLCHDLEVPLTVVDGQLAPERRRAVGIEAAARERRYQLLRSEAARINADLIFTAHQKNDQAETVLLGLITGRGPSRLRGIAPLKDGVARPLLEVSPGEIDAFLAARGVSARQDTSNNDTRFLRNRIRAEVLPLLEELNPQIVDALAATARLVAQQQRLLETLTGEQAAKAVTRTVNGSSIEAGRDEAMTARLLAAELARMTAGREARSFKTIRRIIGAREGTRATISSDLEATSAGGIIHLLRRSTPVGPFDVTIRPDETVALPAIQAQATLTRVDAVGEPASRDERSITQRFQLAGATAPTFSVRNRRKGDRFRPLGMKSDKKLKDFLIDRKIPRDIRDRIPLLVWDNQLVWVGGIEVSDTFRISDEKSMCFEITVIYDE